MSLPGQPDAPGFWPGKSSHCVLRSKLHTLKHFSGAWSLGNLVCFLRFIVSLAIIDISLGKGRLRSDNGRYMAV